MISSLSSSAVQYENFLWVESNSISESLVSNAIKPVIRVNKPFHYKVDNDLIDLKTQSLPDNDWFNSVGSTNANFQLIQFKGPIKSRWLEQIQNSGAVLVSPMAPFTWIVWADQSQLDELKQLASVRQAHYLYSAFRVQANNRQLTASATPTMALVLTPELNQSVEQLRQLGAIIASQSRINKTLSVINFRLDGDQYLQASQISGVMTLQRVHSDGGARTELSQQTIVSQYDGSVNAVPGYATWLSGNALDGSGVTVGVVDGGIYQNHPDLTNVIQCTGTGPSCSDDSDSHGTHVAGAIGGTGAAGVLDPAGFNRGMGVAPGVTIVEQLYAPLLGNGPGSMLAGGMLSIYKDSATSGVLLTNNSWGPTGTPQGYDIPTMEIDMISRDANAELAGNQPVLAVWSIMNGNGDGGGACSPSSLGSPDEAKNLFAVGSTSSQSGNLSQANNVFEISGNSAHGPACDGRLVPHIVAPGCSTDAPDSPSGYGLKCGTSMASPVISGAVSLFWEHYRNQFLQDPSPALIKATFTAVTDDLVGNDDADNNAMSHAPNRQQGWGRVNLENVINPTAPVYYFDQQHVFSESGQNWQINLKVSDPLKPVRMMLVWTDAPGAGMGGTNPAWVNDLDLSVEVGQVYLGNQFGNDAYSAVGGTADAMNNMEAVFLRTDQHNGQDLTIEVMASNIAADALNPHDPGAPQQDFALACYNCEVDNGMLIDLIFEDGFDPFIDLIFIDGFE
ncbi:S8 family serine peptidase [Marinicella litoralis]|nr:S8 family serine peptidase [Marinicella litoralis]